ncbi:hypothetical protein ACIBQX_22770 [Nonomuraea sp. NPDC049714]|uniref:hypothetical protein n=1 Tax=Nonomuraea sp. NPDC049714 TaxID=3364357 RepID=UPI0037961BF4
MTTVGFIGSGYIGSTIARLAIEAGEAAAAGDIVVVTVPVKAFPHLPAVPRPRRRR